MAGKRTASRDINHENWDDEDEPEEAGVFQRAPEDIIKSRVIKTAKRRNPISSSTQGGENDKQGAFTGFSGFTKPATPTSSMFSFLSNTTKTEPPKMNGVAPNPLLQSPMFKTSVTTSADNANSNGNLDEYYGKLKGLNESVSKVIQTHVNSNPFINLQPIFKDYEKYINELESMKVSANKTTSETDKPVVDPPSPKTNAATVFSSFVFKPSASTVETSTSSVSKPTTSNSLLKPPSQDKLPQFNFGSNTSSLQSVPSKITFGAPDLTRDLQKPTENKTPTENDAENEDEPPKVEFTPVVEQGHVFTTRCKVFVKKDNSYADRGVGNLFLKPVPNSEKFQLIVRADTNLGNLLCNFILSEGIPMQRLGKKDVMLVCLPTPESKPPPVPLLLRVKSPEDADDLLAVLEKHKK